MRMFYTAAWCLTNEKDFRNAIPFELLGESILRHKSSLKFNIVILEGIHLLSEEYLEALTNYGFTIIDYCKEFSFIIERYPAIDNFYVRYERNCFLRWIAFKELCEQNKVSQFWHLDGDVVLHTSLDELADDTKGKTFMLQGCPVLVSVSNFFWFLSFESELKALDNNVGRYSELAFQMKQECKKNDLLLANDSLYRNPIGSDQDLLEYLISSKKSPQDTSEVIFKSKYYFIQNPLSIERWHDLQSRKDAFFKFGAMDKILIDRKEVPFIHYQGTFYNYAKIYLLLDDLFIPKWIIRLFLKFQIRETEFKTSLIFRVLFKISKRLLRDDSRSNLIKKLMERTKRKEMRIVGLMNHIISYKQPQ